MGGSEVLWVERCVDLSMETSESHDQPTAGA